MSNRLVPGMFGAEFTPKPNALFGLQCGQMTSPDLVHNGGWYNKAGEKIGWGDLSSENFRRLTAELRDGELFIVLSENDSYWSARRNGIDCDRPGSAYVADTARYIITKGKLFYVERSESERIGRVVERGGILREIISPETAKAMIID